MPGAPPREAARRARDTFRSIQELEDFGEQVFLIVPNDHHQLDAKIGKDAIRTSGFRRRASATVA